MKGDICSNEVFSLKDKIEKVKGKVLKLLIENATRFCGLLKVSKDFAADGIRTWNYIAPYTGLRQQSSLRYLGDTLAKKIRR